MVERDTSSPYVFISYAHVDADSVAAEKIESFLTSSAVRVFRDTHIPSSANWDMTIEQALRECDRMVLLLSPASMPQRRETHREWFYFDQMRKPVHPIYIRECTFHSRMYAYNYIDARH